MNKNYRNRINVKEFNLTLTDCFNYEIAEKIFRRYLNGRVFTQGEMVRETYAIMSKLVKNDPSLNPFKLSSLIYNLIYECVKLAERSSKGALNYYLSNINLILPSNQHD